MKAHRRVMTTDAAERFETLSSVLNRWIEVYITPSPLGGLSVTFRDIDDRKRAEAALRESEERFRALFAASPVPFMVLKPNTPNYTITAANGAYFAATKTTPETLIGRSLFDVFPDDPRRPGQLGSEALDISLKKLLATKRTDVMPRVRYDLALPGGFEPNWWEAINAPMLDPSGEVSAIIHQVHRVTELHQSELAEQMRLKRQGFLLTLSDALRPLSDAAEMQAATTRLLGAHLGVDRAVYVEVEGEGGAETGSIRAQYGRPAMAGDAAAIPFPEQFTFGPFGRHTMAARYRGEPLIVADVDADPRFGAPERTAWAAVHVRAALVVPLARAGRLLAEFGVHCREPRAWTSAELSLVDEVAGRTWAAAERARAEAALRKSEERQAFLLKFSDALRAEPSEDAIIDLALRMLAEELRLDRCYATVLYPEQDLTDVIQEFRRPGLTPMPLTLRNSDFPAAEAQTFRGTLIFNDTANDPTLTDADKRSLAAMNFAALLSSPLRYATGYPFWSLGAVSSEPRRWTSSEVALMEEATERTWAAVERARAEAALRTSEERFQQFAQASAAGLWIREARTLAMEFTSPAIAKVYGVEPDALLGDVKHWASIIVPEDRDTALGHLDRARAGETATHEFRIQRPADRTFRWIRTIDFPLHGDGLIQRVGGIAEDVTESKLAVEHQGVLLAELQHRVRNVMAIMRSIIARTGERAESVAEFGELISGRLMAFARVQALLTRAANVSVDIGSIIHDEVSVQAQHEGQYVLLGPEVALSPKAAEVLTLAVHELATNALKYGALSVPNGKITVQWATFEKRGAPWLNFDWTEEGAPARPQPNDQPRRRGFGSELIEGRVPYELGGVGKMTVEKGGAQCRLQFPLRSEASILETGAPQRATVFGGALDVTAEGDLTGRRVMVVEDDYYLAIDVARAMLGAGAEVAGPCPTEAAARAELAQQRPDAVVLDINLGAGATFKLAEVLKDGGIPFVFVTGYDQGAMPAEFADVERLEKPVQLRRIVNAVSRLLGPDP